VENSPWGVAVLAHPVPQTNPYGSLPLAAQPNAVRPYTGPSKAESHKGKSAEMGKRCFFEGTNSVIYCK
jgi:hypothetical protein